MDRQHLATIIRQLFGSATIYHRTNAAHTLITSYNLPFIADNIIKAIYNLEYGTHREASILFWLSLTNNVQLFIAVIHALLNDKLPNDWYLYLFYKSQDTQKYVLGCNWADGMVVNLIDSATKIWSDLYDYNEFDISELVLADNLRKRLQQHIGSKCRYTKPAIKVASLTKQAVI